MCPACLATMGMILAGTASAGAAAAIAVAKAVKLSKPEHSAPPSGADHETPRDRDPR
jgi:hypothetical protein